MPRGGSFNVAGKSTRKAGSRSSGSTNTSGVTKPRSTTRTSRWAKALTIGKKKKKKK